MPARRTTPNASATAAPKVATPSDTPTTVITPPPTNAAASSSSNPAVQDVPAAVLKPTSSSGDATAGSDATLGDVPNSFAEVFSLHSPSPEPYQLISDFGVQIGDGEDSEPADKDKRIRPGPLTNEQKAQCHAIAEEYTATMLRMAEEWGVHETTVSRQCGLGVKEHRGPNQWCIWQERWFPENPQRATDKGRMAPALLPRV
ncbi:hypothetical protein BOTBODRAFT_517321 [Botryobasidium botryosum FD-172 SS1]|uniref:Uncharacterized protein n=1 Tax=Botryobasidium botryosum (strain FD-172 SS1) TaxID=930990 RepID=A0A067N3B4_BOTB1|nr:hypothetical protein BOTBODRAFT_517321 [Botryobasidium botryosum FD-172 SS1]